MADFTDRDARQPTGDVLRTLFAAERTFLAWIRTGLSMMGFGFLIERFGLFLQELAASNQMRVPTSPRMSLWLGTSLIILGVAVNVFGAIEHLLRVREIAGNVSWARRGTRYGVVLSMLLALIGIVLAVYVHTLS